MGNVRPSDCQLTVEYFAQPTDVCLAGMILDWGFHQKESQNQPEILGDTPRNRILKNWDVVFPIAVWDWIWISRDDHLWMGASALAE